MEAGHRDRVYLDHAATTPLREEVRQAMLPYLRDEFGNASSVHRWGRVARSALEEARERVAASLGAQRGEIVFTGCGTESDNLAVLGRWRWLQASGTGPGPIALSAVEHAAVGGAASQAQREGAEVIVLGVREDGVLDLSALDEALAAAPALVSVMWGNNEVGVLQPIHDVAHRCRAGGVLFHTDAVQAVGKVRVRVDEVPLDMLSLSAHKLGGPKGFGALYVREGVALEPLTWGGGQERALHPGTENVAGAVGLSTALELAVREQEAEAARLAELRDTLEHQLSQAVPDAIVLGHQAPRLPHITSVVVPQCDQEALIFGLDLEGIAVSGGSACHSGSVAPSHVLVAMGLAAADHAMARFSLGHTTRPDDMQRAATAFRRAVNRIRGSESEHPAAPVVAEGSTADPR